MNNFYTVSFSVRVSNLSPRIWAYKCTVYDVYINLKSINIKNWPGLPFKSAMDLEEFKKNGHEFSKPCII